MLNPLLYFVDWRDYIVLCKPKVVALMVLTALVGMHLATNTSIPLSLLVTTTVGIALAGASAATVNHIADRHLDTLMHRTEKRPVASGRVTPQQALIFAMILGLISMILLVTFVNALTAWLSLLTLVGYAGIYTLYLKRATPQNIVIGGLSGAAPPLLGWVAVTHHIDPQALLLVLIIFVWTPPHFWALAIHREKEYAKANIPMLTSTHGIALTRLHILLYSTLLCLITVMPVVIRMSGLIYLIGSLLLNARFMYWAFELYRYPEKTNVPMKFFRFSITYLFALFVILLIDHHCPYVF